MRRSLPTVPLGCLAAVAVVLSVLFAPCAARAAGELDPTFVNPDASSVLTLRTLPDGKLLIAGGFGSVGGQSRSRVARINANGTVDTSFADPSVNMGVHALATQPGGKVIIGGVFDGVGGQPRVGPVRLDAAGTLDNTFTGPSFTNGFSSRPYIWALESNAEGKVLVGGAFDSAGGQPRGRVTRLNADGSLDTSFSNPDASDWVSDFLVQPDEKVVIAGVFRKVAGESREGVARLNSNGTLDLSFDDPAVNGWCFASALQADGKIVIAGDFTSVSGKPRSRVARLNADGSVDESFANVNADGTVRAVEVQPDGRILIGGDFTSVAGQSRDRVARINSDGTLDTSFTNANVNGTVHAMAVLADGKVLVAGQFAYVSGQRRVGVARLLGDGAPGPTPTPNPSPEPAPDPVAPVFASTAAVSAASGVVKVRAPGSREFVDVASGSTVEIRDGAEVDTTGGQARLSYQEAPGSGDRSVDVSDGRFVFDQRRPRSADPVQADSVTELSLSAPLASRSARRSLRLSVLAASACSSPYKLRKVRGRKQCGRFVTRKVKGKKRKVWVERSRLVSEGSNGVGTDEGTEYEITDSLPSTTFRVFSGRVLATGGKPAKTVTIKAGKAYTFKAKKASKKR